MKSLFAVLIFWGCSIASAQGKYRFGQQNPADQNASNYSIKVHISATHLRSCTWVSEYGRCYDALYVDAVLNGKKLELVGVVDKKTPPMLIAPGDYVACPTIKPHDGGGPVFYQGYFVLLPNKTAWPCSVTGFSE
jgi:hypothetical protein